MVNARGGCRICRRRILINKSGLLRVHKPYTRAYSGEFVTDCAGSGTEPKKPKRGGST